MSAVKCPTCGRTWICMTGTPASISPMILCKKCKGEYPAQQECEACGGNGLDPESFCGCCEEPEPEEGAP
jgi:hypothetical protein